MRDKDRVRCATYMLRDDASLWWEGAVHGVNLATFTRDQLKDIFYNKYFQVELRGRLMREFMSLRQGDLSVEEFIRKFKRGVAMYALLVSRVIHSFMSESFLKQLGIIPEGMDLRFRVSIPSGDQMFTSQIVKRLELRLQKNAVQVDLIVIPLPEFDIILGMGWLSWNGDAIDFRSMSKAHEERLQAFLACIVTVTEPVIQRLEEVEVARDFPSVFPDDILGIPPDREIDRVAFLGHNISQDGVEVYPRMVEAVRDWPAPKSVTGIRSLLGLAGYYRKFMKRISSTALTKKNAKFILGSE
ncbi:uncharacterized protein [Primulina eburnea]|uniref:uncharacterized protein n=1 Tax=Primulina eburnea TaxID=1245227 RepID=UPI003C6CAAFD